MAARIWLILCWYSFVGMLNISKGSFQKLSLSKRVMRRYQFGARGMLLKARVGIKFAEHGERWTTAWGSSTWGIGWASGNTHSLKGLRSMQILILPDPFGTITIPTHQGVGSVTLESTPYLSILSSSSFTLVIGVWEHSWGWRGHMDILPPSSLCCTPPLGYPNHERVMEISAQCHLPRPRRWSLLGK